MQVKDSVSFLKDVRSLLQRDMRTQYSDCALWVLWKKDIENGPWWALDLYCCPKTRSYIRGTHSGLDDEETMLLGRWEELYGRISTLKEMCEAVIFFNTGNEPLCQVATETLKKMTEYQSMYSGKSKLWWQS